MAQVAKDLNLTRSALENWVRQARVDAGRGASGALTTSEKEELARLRRENHQLRMEREILKKRRPSSRLLAEGGLRGAEQVKALVAPARPEVPELAQPEVDLSWLR